MKSQTQTSAEMRHLADLLQEHRVAMLTIDDASTGLGSRPMTPLEMDRDGAIWMMASKESMQPLLGRGTRPVNLAFVRHDHSDYVSIAGEASLVDDARRKTELWSAAGQPWFDGPEDPDLTLLRVQPRHAEIWDGPDSSITRVLAMTASVVAGREVGLGSKETIDAPAAR